MKRNKKKSEEHANSERWLLTYADLITLLLGLFVILYAMSKIDANKYVQVVSALGGAFGKEGVPTLEGGGSGKGDVRVERSLSESETTEQTVKAALESAISNKMVAVTGDERGITVHLAEELLFSSGNAALKGSSLQTLNVLAEVLKTIPNEIRIEGHTDDVPINTVTYASNWHLSVARAMNTGFYLLEHHGLNAEKISIIGHSQYRPITPNISPENRAKNRRVDIVIVTNPSHNGGDHKTVGG